MVVFLFRVLFFLFFVFFFSFSFGAPNWSNSFIDVNFFSSSDVSGFGSGPVDVNFVSGDVQTGLWSNSSFDLNVGVFFPEKVIRVCNFNGIQDDFELGVDCGNDVCPACAPVASCNDGIQNQGELGVDCGGPCPACGVSAPASSGGGGGGGGPAGGSPVAIRELKVEPLSVGVPSTISFLVANGLPNPYSFLAVVQIFKGNVLEFSFEQSVPTVFSGRVVRVVVSEKWVPSDDSQRRLVVSLYSPDRSKRYDFVEKNLFFFKEEIAKLVVDEFSKVLVISPGEVGFFGIKVKNVGSVEVKDLNVILEGLPYSWYSFDQEKRSLLPSESAYFVLKLNVPLDAEKRSYLVAFRVFGTNAFVDFSSTLSVIEPSAVDVIFRDVVVEDVYVGGKGRIRGVIFNPSSNSLHLVVSISAPSGWSFLETEKDIFLGAGEEKEFFFDFVAPSFSGVETLSVSAKRKDSFAFASGSNEVVKRFFVIVKSPDSDFISLALRFSDFDLLMVFIILSIGFASLFVGLWRLKRKFFIIPKRKF
ncbi:MAG: hypothetical protein QXD98_03435 [Candidatus Diapherotrites archaeon]